MKLKGCGLSFQLTILGLESSLSCKYVDLCK